MAIPIPVGCQALYAAMCLAPTGAEGSPHRRSSLGTPPFALRGGAIDAIVARDVWLAACTHVPSLSHILSCPLIGPVTRGLKLPWGQDAICRKGGFCSGLISSPRRPWRRPLRLFNGYSILGVPRCLRFSVAAAWPIGGAQLAAESPAHRAASGRGVGGRRARPIWSSLHLFYCGPWGLGSAQMYHRVTKVARLC